MKIVITGIGIVSALGIGKEANKIQLLNEKSGIAEPALFKTACHEYPVAELKMTDSDIKHLLLSKDNSILSRTVLFGILASREALQQAKFPTLDEYFVLDDTAFINGTTVGGMDFTETHWVNKDIYATSIAQNHSIGSCTHNIATSLGHFKYTTTISTACSAALNTIVLACNLLRSNIYDKVLVGGTECLTLFHFNGFRSLQLLSNELCRPFCTSHRGLNLGEGAAYLVLETEESAKKRNADILCYVGGYANTCDAFHQTTSSNNGIGAFMAMDTSLQMTNLTLSDIDYIHTHGTATKNNDQSEGQAIVTLTQKYNTKNPTITSTKPFTGHTTSVSGTMALVISILGMQEDCIFAHLNDNIPMNTSLPPLVHNTYRQHNTVLCNSFGFGGNDSSVLISRYPLDLPDTPINASKEIMSDTIIPQQDKDVNYLSGNEARRLTPAMRRLAIATRQLLSRHALQQPDAIITGTTFGCISNTIQLLNTLINEGEDCLSPTLFMQSTHNTPSSLIAILLQCHNYNCTYSDNQHATVTTILDAKMQIQAKKIKNALIIDYDEENEIWQNLMQKGNMVYTPNVKVTLISNND